MVHFLHLRLLIPCSIMSNLSCSFVSSIIFPRYIPLCHLPTHPQQTRYIFDNLPSYPSPIASPNFLATSRPGL